MLSVRDIGNFVNIMRTVNLYMEKLLAHKCFSFSYGKSCIYY
jgi:hypothetical protein